MAKHIGVGDMLPFFLYDTPYSAQNRFRDLLRRRAPLVLVFMANFGHPITRTFAMRYADTYGALQDGGFALVVRSRADKLSRSIRRDTLPYPLLCDADGVLYEHLDIPQSNSTLMSCSLEGLRILREAKQQGYRPVKGKPQQLPLTLILDSDGTVLFCHYGASLTDVPQDCAAMQSMLEELDLVPEADEAEPDADDEPEAPPERKRGRFWRKAARQEEPATDEAEDPTGDFEPPTQVHEYITPDLAMTAITGLFDDPYGDE